MMARKTFLAMLVFATFCVVSASKLHGQIFSTLKVDVLDGDDPVDEDRPEENDSSK